MVSLSPATTSNCLPTKAWKILQAVPLVLGQVGELVSSRTDLSREFPDWGYGFVIAVGVVVLFMIVRSNRPTNRLKSVREKMSSPEDNPFENSAE